MSAYQETGFWPYLIIVFWFMASPSVSLAEEQSVFGIYILVEVNGETLPTPEWPDKVTSDGCKEEILSGAVILDSDGKSAEFLTVRKVCVHEDGSETVSEEDRGMWTGPYQVSGHQLTIQGDRAVLNGDLLILKVDTESESRTSVLVFQRE
ncbi:MAG: hypothetical protein KJO56_12770 [Gammaproteobacteria bacterium]|nr:hypothetical protein [Gammaproteobacteria bacterium]